MSDISGFGLIATVKASVTFPVGVPITQFADDIDPLDIAALELAQTAMGLNGNLITWSKPNPIMATLAVVPGSLDDIALGIIAEANRVAAGKRPARDIITLTLVYPSGNVITLSKGAITSAIPGNPVASQGRMKSKPYIFAFENKVSAL